MSGDIQKISLEEIINLYDLSFDLSFKALQNICFKMIPSLITTKKFEKTFEIIYNHSKDEMESLLNFYINFYVDHTKELILSKKNRLICDGRSKVLFEIPKVVFKRKLKK